MKLQVKPLGRCLTNIAVQFAECREVIRRYFACVHPEESAICGIVDPELCCRKETLVRYWAKAAPVTLSAADRAFVLRGGVIFGPAQRAVRPHGFSG